MWALLNSIYFTVFVVSAVNLNRDTVVSHIVQRLETVTRNYAGSWLKGEQRKNWWRAKKELILCATCLCCVSQESHARCLFNLSFVVSCRVVSWSCVGYSIVKTSYDRVDSHNWFFTPGQPRRVIMYYKEHNPVQQQHHRHRHHHQ